MEPTGYGAEKKQLFEIARQAKDFFSHPEVHYSALDKLFENGRAAEDVQLFLSEQRTLEAITDRRYLSSIENRRPDEVAPKSTAICNYNKKIENALSRAGRRFKEIFNTALNGDSIREVIGKHQQIMCSLEHFVQLYEHDALREMLPKAIRKFAEAKPERSANAHSRSQALDKLKDDYISGAWKISGGVLNILNATRKAGEQNALESIAGGIERAILESCTTRCSPLLGEGYAELIDEIRDAIANYDDIAEEEKRIAERAERMKISEAGLSAKTYPELIRIVDEAAELIMSRKSPSNLYLNRLFMELKNSAIDLHHKAEYSVEKGRMDFALEMERLLKSLSYRSNELYEDEQLARGCFEELGRIKSKYKGLYSEADLLPAESKRKAILHNCAEARRLIDSADKERKTLEKAVSEGDLNAISESLKRRGDLFGQRHNVYAKEAVSRYLGVARTAEKMLKDDSDRTADGLRSEISGLRSEVEWLGEKFNSISKEKEKYEQLAKELSERLAGNARDSDAYKEKSEAENKRISDEFGQYRQGSERERKELSDRLEKSRADAEQREKALQDRLSEREDEIKNYQRQLNQKNSDDLSSKGKKELKARIAELEGEVAEVKEEYLSLKAAYDTLRGEKTEAERKISNYEVPLQEVVKLSDIPPRSAENGCLFMFGDHIKDVPVEDEHLYEIKAIALGQRGHNQWTEKLQAINSTALPDRARLSRKDEGFLRKFEEYFVRSAREGNVMKCIAYGSLSLDIINSALSRIRNYLSATG